MPHSDRSRCRRSGRGAQSSRVPSARLYENFWAIPRPNLAAAGGKTGYFRRRGIRPARGHACHHLVARRFGGVGGHANQISNADDGMSPLGHDDLMQGIRPRTSDDEFVRVERDMGVDDLGLLRPCGLASLVTRNVRSDHHKRATRIEGYHDFPWHQ